MPWAPARCSRLSTTALDRRGDKSVGGAEWWRVPHLMPCAVAAVIGIAISLSCWFAASVREDRLAELELTARTNSHAMVLQGEIGDYLDKLVALRAFFGASEAVSRPEFTTFSDNACGKPPLRPSSESCAKSNLSVEM